MSVQVVADEGAHSFQLQEVLHVQKQAEEKGEDERKRAERVEHIVDLGPEGRGVHAKEEVAEGDDDRRHTLCDAAGVVHREEADKYNLDGAWRM